MTGTFPRLLTKQLFITLLIVYVASTARLRLNKRSITEGLFDGPCFSAGGEAPALPRSLNESMVDLTTRTAGLKQYAKLLKDFLKKQYQMKDSTTQHLDLLYWMNREEMVVSDEVLKEATSKTSETLQSHYHLLSEYRLYVEQLRTNGTIAEKKPEEETRDKLHSFEVKVDSCMCSLSIAVQSFGHYVNNNVSIDHLEPEFLENSSPLTNATYRAYISMQDGISLMEFLNTIYQRVQTSIASTNSSDHF